MRIVPLALLPASHPHRKPPPDLSPIVRLPSHTGELALALEHPKGRFQLPKVEQDRKPIPATAMGEISST